MTMTFEYTFTVLKKRDGSTGRDPGDWYREPVTLRARITDKTEPRDAHKPGEAANRFNKILREQYGYGKSVVTACRIKRIK